MERKYQSLSEVDLIAKIRKGDYAAFTEVYSRYSPLIYRHARGVMKNSSAAEDILQDVFIVVWEMHDRLEVKTNLLSYLYGITRNTCLRNLRKSKQADGYLNTLQKECERLESITEEYIFKKEECRILEEEINLLPERMRKVIQLSRTGEMSYQEISAQESIPVGTIRNQVSAAYKLLRPKLQKLLFSIF